MKTPYSNAPRLEGIFLCLAMLALGVQWIVVGLSALAGLLHQLQE
jgi:hypothetical protein